MSEVRAHYAINVCRYCRYYKPNFEGLFSTDSSWCVCVRPDTFRLQLHYNFRSTEHNSTQALKVRVACPTLEPTCPNLHLQNIIFCRRKIVMRQLWITITLNCFSFRMVIYYFRGMPTVRKPRTTKLVQVVSELGPTTLMWRCGFGLGSQRISG